MIVYVLLCVINSITLATLNVGVTSWQYWVSLFCVIGAWICGKEL